MIRFSSVPTVPSAGACEALVHVVDLLLALFGTSSMDALVSSMPFSCASSLLEISLSKSTSPASVSFSDSTYPVMSKSFSSSMGVGGERENYPKTREKSTKNAGC